MTNIVVYQWATCVWWWNVPRWEHINQDTKKAIQRLLFIDVEDDMLRKLEYLANTSKSKLASVLLDSLDDNPYTYYMN